MDPLWEGVVKAYLYEEEFVPSAMASVDIHSRWSTYLHEVKADYASLMAYEADREAEREELGSADLARFMQHVVDLAEALTAHMR